MCHGIRTTGTLRDEHEFVQLFSAVITSAFRLSWFVSRSTQTLQNRLPWNLDGGWVLAPNRPHSFLVGIRIKEWIHKPFLTFFNIARSGVFFVVDIFVNFPENDAWILIKKKYLVHLGGWYLWVNTIWWGLLPLPELGGRHSNFGVCAHQVGMWEQHGRQKKVVLHFMAQSV